MNGMYVLGDDPAVPIPCDDLLEWGRWMQNNRDRKRVARTLLHDDKVVVSTVFLGLDHSLGEGEPLLWETMIFGGEHNDSQWRYSTLLDAEFGHLQAVELARNGHA